jgi:phosphoribosylformylglycinamidine cyclo-ligase
MFKVFNMGHRMELYVKEKHAPVIISAAAAHGVEAKVVGHVEASEGKKLTIESGQEILTYP